MSVLDDFIAKFYLDFKDLDLKYFQYYLNSHGLKKR